MRVEVLVSTMNQSDHSIIDKMNIQTDAIIINQCNRFSFEEFKHNGRNIKFISLDERGVGLSRNTALMRATGDICIFADDDVVYVDNYEEIIINSFKENPRADVIMFNIPSTNTKRPTYVSNNKFRVRWYNCLRFGAVKIAVRTQNIRESNIYFSLLFGGGARFSAGEDVLFVVECIKKGLHTLSLPCIIGYVNQNTSTWFNGYTDKYFIDKGILYSSISKKWAKLLCLQFCIRHKNIFKKDKSCKDALKLMIKGTKYLN